MGGQLLSLLIIVASLAHRQTGTVQASEAVMYSIIRVWLLFPIGTQRTPTVATPSQHPHK